MDNTKLLRIGIIGTVIVALCCFTPILVILLATVGLSALTGYLDFVLLPALILFLGIVGIVGYAIVRKQRAERRPEQNVTCCETDHKDEDVNEKR